MAFKGQIILNDSGPAGIFFLAGKPEKHDRSLWPAYSGCDINHLKTGHSDIPHGWVLSGGCVVLKINRNVLLYWKVG
jgi:hypothetical protein